MEGLLKIGTILHGESGNTYTVKKYLGAGGQGEVYDVEYKGTHYALKWYFPKMATKDQKEILDNLISKGAPDRCFLWPEDMIFTRIGDSFGYIMPLRPANYKSIVDLMKRRADPSFLALCRAAYNLTLGYQKLHKMGFSYRDISFGNMFFDPQTGDVLICDNDNVAANGASSSVYGTPRFMAPEIVRGEAKPSRNTDQFSLAVLLFYMFMIGHPLEGQLEANIKCMDVAAMNKLYGSNPVFIFDPNNKTNYPVKGYQDNPIIYWEIIPQNLKDLFIASFTIGLREPNRRITENEWLRAFANMITGITECSCGAEIFFDENKFQNNEKHICWNCRKNVAMPHFLQIGKNKILLNRNGKIYSHNIHDDFDMSTIVGVVNQNPNDPKLWGIKNETQMNWTYIRPDGTQQTVAPGRSAGINKNVKIDFGEVIGEFI